MRVFLIEPYYTGSHQAWVDGWMASSRHEVHAVTMEGRFWKWRMHGGPVTVAADATSLAASVGLPDAIVASSMLDLATFKGLVGNDLGNPPSLLYMHENQLTYPLSPRTRGEDLSYAFVNWRAMLTADAVVFNTDYHRDAFFEAVGPFLKNFPDYRHLDLVESVEAKSSVIGVGIPIRASIETPGASPLILWNQRWEYDKNPVEMFEILYAVADQGIDYRLAICGENFRQTPTEFEDAQQHLGERIVQFGFAEDDRYDELVADSDVVVSTAHHEFFGISVAEAMASGAFPVVPNRLSYPEMVPAAVHPLCLYKTTEQAVSLLANALTTDRSEVTAACTQAMAPFGWDRIGPAYDDAVDALVGR